jgi:N-acyl-D-amino-acid deacylase
MPGYLKLLLIRMKQQHTMHETVIINGLVPDPIEGLQKLNLAINRGIITKVTPDLLTGEEVIDAEGKYVSPGFIDIHMHTYPFDQTGFIETLKAMALMGVTTVLDGHCGLGSSDLVKSEAAFLKEPSPVNYSCLVGGIETVKAGQLTGHAEGKFLKHE